MSELIDPIDARFMAAVGWSEDMLEAIENGWEPPCTSADLERVCHDAFQAMARDVPDPVEYAAMIEPVFAEAIMEAVHGRTGGLWVSDNALVPMLRSMGLIGIRDRELSPFAMQVRRVLRRDEG